jgi:hypothetical protein
MPVPRLPGMWTAEAGEHRQWQTHAQLARGFSERNGADAAELPEHARRCSTCGAPSERICVLDRGKDGGVPDKQPTCPSCVADDFLQYQLAGRGVGAVTPPYDGGLDQPGGGGDRMQALDGGLSGKATAKELDAVLESARELLTEALTLEKEDTGDWASSAAFADCQALAVSIKSRGNAAFKSGRWHEALQLYIDTIALDSRSKGSAPSYSNLAATFCAPYSVADDERRRI